MPLVPPKIIAGSTTYTFDVWNGPIYRLQNEGSYFKRLGQSGSYNQILGRQAPDSSCNGVIFLNEDVGRTYRAALPLLKDTLVKFVDGYGEEFPRLWVKAIQADLKAIAGMGKTHCLLVAITLELQP